MPIQRTGWTTPDETFEKWNKEQLATANLNSQGLNAIFMVVCQEEFKRNSTFEIANEAQTILKTIHEGTQIVKNSKIPILHLELKKLITREDEIFGEFYAKLNDIVNSNSTYVRSVMSLKSQNNN